MRKKIVHPGQHERARGIMPSPILRCATCAAAGAGVHTTVYIKPPPAPAGRDAAKGIQKRNKKMYTLLYTQRIKLCTYYRIQCRINYVHTTLHTVKQIVYTLPYTKRKAQKEEQKRQARVYTNGMVVRLREQAKQVQARVYKNERRVRPQEQEGGSRLGCTKIKKNCTPLVG